MKISVHKFKEADSQFWDDFVWSADNGTIFHTRLFLSYHPKRRFTDHSLVFKRKNSVKALFPAIDITMDKDRVLYSHRGATYGGFVYKDVGIHDAFDIVECLKKYAKEKGFTKILITLSPMLYMNRYSNYIDFAMIQNGFRYLKREISSILQLPETEEQILPMFKSEARTAVRKSMKQGVIIKRSNDFFTYYEILKKNLRMRHHVKPTHSLEELEKLSRLFPEKIHLWAAYLNDKMIAGVVNFICTSNVVLAYYISDNKEFQEYRAVNNLFFHIFRWAVGERFRIFDFGIFTVNMDPNWGLGKFKESFGARGLFRDTFELLL